MKPLLRKRWGRITGEPGWAGWGRGGGGRPQCGQPGHLHCRVLEGRCDDLKAGSCAWILVTWVTKLVTGSMPLYSGIWRI